MALVVTRRQQPRSTLTGRYRAGVQLIRISNRWPGVTLQLGVTRGLCAIVSKKNDLAPDEEEH